MMFRVTKTSAAVVLCCAVAGAGLVGCDDSPKAKGSSGSPTATTARQAAESFSGVQKIDVEGRAVNVSCSGNATKGRPVVVLMSGLGDGLDKMAPLQKTLSEKDRVCSYDRLGQGASDQPGRPQDFDAVGKVLTAVLDRVAGDGRVVLAAHSLGGMIAARYAPDHRDKVAGLVLMDATSPTSVADITNRIPASATGASAEVRGQTLAVDQGENPEQLVITDVTVRSAGDIPVEVIQHGQQYLAAAVPEYGPGLEQAWAEGQRKWLALSGRSKPSTAANSGHYIYLDQPDIAVEAIRRVTAQAAG
jgi:thioesterase domain-containing protein